VLSLPLQLDFPGKSYSSSVRQGEKEDGGRGQDRNILKLEESVTHVVWVYGSTDNGFH
jgi:hypothetical protein